MNYPAYLDAIVSESGVSGVLKTLLFDGVTGLPTLPLLIDSLRDVANDHQKLGIIFIHMDALEELELHQGWETVDELIGAVPSFLDMLIPEFSPLKIFSVQRLPGDNFLLVIHSNEPTTALTLSQLVEVNVRLEMELNAFLAERVSADVEPYARVFSGYSMMEVNSSVRFERLIARSINKAFLLAVDHQEETRQKQIDELRDLISRRQIFTFFQPVMNLKNQTEILGYEALSSGPAGTHFEKSHFLFHLAANHGLLRDLESLSQELIISRVKPQLHPGLLFVNLDPALLEEDRYLSLPLFQNSVLDPGRTVIEITERAAIVDLEKVSLSLSALRKSGFRIAVDDVGSGFASLQSIAYLRPDFIKLDGKMALGISDDFIKQEIVKTLRDLAMRLTATVIAEGIERQEDLKMLQRLGISFGQGYLLSPPMNVL